MARARSRSPSPHCRTPAHTSGQSHRPRNRRRAPGSPGRGRHPPPAGRWSAGALRRGSAPGGPDAEVPAPVAAVRQVLGRQVLVVAAHPIHDSQCAGSPRLSATARWRWDPVLGPLWSCPWSGRRGPAPGSRVCSTGRCGCSTGPAGPCSGIAGAPASGKSTLAALLLAELERQRPGEAVGVGMDAFHIGHRVLVRRGQTEIKGAPETFDAARVPAPAAADPDRDRHRLRARVRPGHRGLAGPRRRDRPRGRAGGHRGQLPAAGHPALGRRTRAARRGLVRAPGRRRAAAADDAPGTCGTATTRTTPRPGPSATTSATPSWSTPRPNHPDLWIEQSCRDVD